ncbi:MAG TPA: GAF domain-containing protein [Solirubrobacterales bacterium]|nr:GAF domain-containing protein [Solirubrobacterales bacterium]
MAARGPTTAGFPEVVEAFNEISGAITEHVALDALLHIVALRICDLLDVRRCSVYLMDERTGLFRGQVGHADRNIDAAIKSLTAGIEADGFTREILTTKRPVLIVNAQSDPRPVHSTMLEWNVQTMLGVPMVRDGRVVGLLFLDNEDQPHEYSAGEQQLCGTFANLAAIAISHAQLTTELRSSLKTVERQNRLLRTAAAIEDRLSNLVLKGANLHEITRAVAELTNKPTVVMDAGMRPLATAGIADDGGVLDALLSRLRHDADLAGSVTELESRKPAVIDAAGGSKLAKRIMAAAVMVGTDAWGYLAVVEQGGWFNAQDRIVLRRAGTIIALEMSAERRAADAEMRAQETLARDLIVGTDDPASLQRRAHFHGLHLNAPHVVMLFASGEGRKPPNANRVFKALSATHPECNPLAVGIEDGVAAVIELGATEGEPAGVEVAKRVAADMATALTAEGVVSVAISGICEETAQYPSAFREAQQVARCISVFCPPDSYRVLSSADIGAARLLLSGTSREDAERFALDWMSELLEPGNEHLLTTLQMFFAASRSVRRSAELLDVHENTIRYRLGRIREVTHLDVAADADDQLTLQLGLLILRLIGRIDDESPGAAQAAAPEESSDPIRSAE